HLVRRDHGLTHPGLVALRPIAPAGNRGHDEACAPVSLSGGWYSLPWVAGARLGSTRGAMPVRSTRRTHRPTQRTRVVSYPTVHHPRGQRTSGRTTRSSRKGSTGRCPTRLVATRPAMLTPRPPRAAYATLLAFAAGPAELA